MPVATMISEIYDALKDAGASEDKARKAAEVMATMDTKSDVKTGKVDADLTMLRADVSILKNDATTLKWMMGFVLAFCIAMLGKLLTLH